MMADILKQQDEFKNMLERYGKAYKDLGNGLILVLDGPLVNIRQYSSDGFCLSSYANAEEFKEKIGGLLGKW